MSHLYVVASPIGNLGDLSERARRVLGEAKRIVAEDTRRARRLLSHLGISGKALSRLDAHAGERDLVRVLEWLGEGATVALLTDAGTPSVSDPGARLVRRCHEQQVPVVPIPGASAVTSAIAASGLVDGPFLFAGFLPRAGGKRQKWLDRIAQTEEAVVIFEAANRTPETLRALAERHPERMACVARELTKKFEYVELRPLSGWLDPELLLRGEVTLVLGPWSPPGVSPAAGDVDDLVVLELAKSKSPREIAEAFHQTLGVSKRALYQRVLELKAQRG